jgi:hypothetical protein
MVGSAAFTLALSLLPAWADPQPAEDKIPLAAAGKKLVETLDAMDVQNRWKAGEHITDWKTGEPDSKTGGPPTHCSLFAAAVCWKLDVPMFDPPPQFYLSGRQQEWLLGEGKEKGWREVKDPVQAQRLANRGVLVLASYRNPVATKPGHIAVVCPAEVGVEAVRERGPRVMQAGARNYRDIDARTGFEHHPRAWKNGEILYFAYDPLKK